MAASSTHESNSISVGVKRSISINKICYKSRVSRVSKPNHPNFSPCIQKPLYKASFSLEVLQLVGKVPFLVNTCPKRTWDAWNFSSLQLLFSAFFLSSFSVSFLSFFRSLDARHTKRIRYVETTFCLHLSLCHFFNFAFTIYRFNDFRARLHFFLVCHFFNFAFIIYRFNDFRARDSSRKEGWKME